MRPPSLTSRTSKDAHALWGAAIVRAESQGGAISHAQLIECGLSPSAIVRRRRSGGLHDCHLGVYALGRPGLGPYGEAWAAALAAGDRGALAGWSAAALMSLAEWPRRPELLVVGGPLRLHGVRVLRTRSLARDEIIEDAAGLRFTAWPRTVTDLAARNSVAELQAVLDALDRRGLLDLPTLDAAIRRARGREGLPKLRRALEPFTTLPDAEYRSLLERFGAMLLRSRALAEHEVNGPVDLPSGRRIHVDILFRDAMVAVEIDGRDSHDRAVQFGIDRERDRELQRLGYRVLRFTWQDVMHHPRKVIRDIRALLGG